MSILTFCNKSMPNQFESSQSTDSFSKKSPFRWLAFSALLVCILTLAATTAYNQTVNTHTIPQAAAPSQTTQSKVVLTETDLNSLIATDLEKSESGKRDISAIVIDIEVDRGSVTATWTNGQQLTADVITNTNNTQLITDNVVMSGAGAFNDTFASIAQKALDAVLQNVARNNNMTLRTVELQKDAVVLYYEPISLDRDPFQ